MSGTGIMFNGVEMKKGEDINEYIHKVVNKIINKQNAIINHSTLTDETDSESESESESDNEMLLYNQFPDNYTNKMKIILGTYDCSMDEHDDIIRWFNNKYKTFERGSNGSKGHYWTHGETLYDLDETKYGKLKQLYERRIGKVRLYNIEVFITYKPVHKHESKQENEFHLLCKNFKDQRDCNRFIEVKDYDVVNRLFEMDFIELKRDYNKQKTTKNHKYKLGDVVFHNSNPHFKYLVFWEVVGITNNMIKCKAISPHVTVKYEPAKDTLLSNNYLIKYTKGSYVEDVKSKYFNKNTHNLYYDFDDYIYRMFNN